MMRRIFIFLIFYIFMSPLIFLHYFYWHYTIAIKELLKIWRNFIIFFWHFFSIGLLLSTIISPWHRITTSYGRGFDPGRYARAWAENVITRGLGAVVRSFVIIIGFIAEIITIVIGIALLIFWLVLPIAMVVGFIAGLLFLFL